MNKEIELKEQDDGKVVRCRIKEGGEVVTVRYFRKDMVDSITEKAKTTRTREILLLLTAFNLKEAIDKIETTYMEELNSSNTDSKNKEVD